ncbi:MAG: Endo-1,4-beta-xylanase A precursor [Candidatus Hydrogenedentes bacterium ADurb.Bin179]|nr:MAG: Endo-1,4-beta-xylanase A precursor [Candidatus Hydrogenedentes bacterium ADurb.Bin179]
MHRGILCGLLIIFILTSCTSTTASPNTYTKITPTTTFVPTSTSIIPLKPDSIINDRLNAVIASYRDLGNYAFTDTQVEKINQSVELVQVQDANLGLSKSYWIISQSKLLGFQEPELAEMLGYIPLAYSEGGLNWKVPGIRDTTNIPIGAQFAQLGNGSAEVLAENFDFFIIATDWGFSSFGDNEALLATGKETKRSIMDYISIVDDKTVILSTDPSFYSWGGYTDFQTQEALKYLQPDKKGMDASHQNRRLVMLPIVYPSSQIPKDFENLNKDQALSFIKQYVRLIVNRYKDRYFAYVGITEFGLDSDVLMKKLGPEYIDLVYQTIRETDPTAILILEHAGNEVPGTDMTQLTLETSTRLEQKNLIDYIASEFHVDQVAGALPEVTQEQIEQVFRTYPVPVFPSSAAV